MILNYLICVVFLLAGGWMLYRAYAPRLKAKQARSWSSTEATILESGIGDDRSRSATGKATIAFVPTIRYRYTVGGKSFEGDRITLFQTGYDYIDASNIKDQFKTDEKMPVYYNPNNPAESVLKPKATVGMFSRVPGYFMLSLGLLLMIYVYVAGK
jgi:hypothetical protein